MSKKLTEYWDLIRSIMYSGEYFTARKLADQLPTPKGLRHPLYWKTSHMLSRLLRESQMLERKKCMTILFNKRGYYRGIYAYRIKPHFIKKGVTQLLINYTW